MSGVMIAILHAFAETPRIPPCVAFEHASSDAAESLTPEEADSTATDSLDICLTEIDTPTDGAETGAPGEDPVEDAMSVAGQEAHLADMPGPSGNPDLWLYRDRTVALLRRYLRLSIEVGRMPSLLGREFFRTRVTSYGSSTFEDSVIFVHDVERSLDELSEFEKKLIAKIVLQQFSKEEAGRLLGCGYRTVERLFPEALDRVSEILLRRRIMTGLPRTKRQVPKSCQEGKNGPFLASD
jgi:DNA-directed RNA polymerase specialized sigma24 family protein